MISEDLKKCPFCGNTNILLDCTYQAVKSYFVCCNKKYGGKGCGTRTKLSRDKNVVIGIWNGRDETIHMVNES